LRAKKKIVLKLKFGRFQNWRNSEKRNVFAEKVATVVCRGKKGFWEQKLLWGGIPAVRAGAEGSRMDLKRGCPPKFLCAAKKKKKGRGGVLGTTNKKKKSGLNRTSRHKSKKRTGPGPEGGCVAKRRGSNRLRQAESHRTHSNRRGNKKKKKKKGGRRQRLGLRQRKRENVLE